MIQVYARVCSLKIIEESVRGYCFSGTSRENVHCRRNWPFSCASTDAVVASLGSDNIVQLLNETPVPVQRELTEYVEWYQVGGEPYTILDVRSTSSSCQEVYRFPNLPTVEGLNVEMIANSRTFNACADLVNTMQTSLEMAREDRQVQAPYGPGNNRYFNAIYAVYWLNATHLRIECGSNVQVSIFNTLGDGYSITDAC